MRAWFHGICHFVGSPSPQWFQAVSDLAARHDAELSLGFSATTGKPIRGVIILRAPDATDADAQRLKHLIEDAGLWRDGQPLDQWATGRDRVDATAH